jgi:hypothetical protein
MKVAGVVCVLAAQIIGIVPAAPTARSAAADSVMVAPAGCQHAAAVAAVAGSEPQHSSFKLAVCWLCSW